MRVGINASFLRKPATGIGQVTEHFLKELAHYAECLQERGQSSKIQFFLYLEEPHMLPSHLQEVYTVRQELPKFWKRDDLIRKYFWETVVLPRQAQQDNCDVFISLYQSSTIFPKSIPHIMVVHDLIPKIFPEYLNNIRKKWYQRCVEKAVKKSNHIIAVSEHSAHDIIRLLNVPKTHISIAYPDTNPQFRRAVPHMESEKVLGIYSLLPGYLYSGGGLEKRKNTESVLQAYALLVEEYIADRKLQTLPRLVISGKLMPQLAPLVCDVEKRVKELGLEKHVDILGFVPQDHMPALYANALIFLFPSLYEGFGLPVLEAMHQGIPVITSDTTSLPEVGGDVVMYCDPTDTRDILRVIQNVIDDPELRAQVSIAEKKRAEDFSWKRFVDKIMHSVRHVQGLGMKD